MEIHTTSLHEVKLFEPTTHTDERGFFRETMRESILHDVGVDMDFVQENHAGSHQNVLRGLHYQVKEPQGKLIWVVTGSVFDVALDVRKDSPTLGQWMGERLDAASPRILWIPPGFAHGYYVLCDWAEIIYKTTAYYNPALERTVAWNDPALDITWPLPEGTTPMLSPRDAEAPLLDRAELYL